jgi:hypothetical protein
VAKSDRAGVGPFQVNGPNVNFDQLLCLVAERGTSIFLDHARFKRRVGKEAELNFAAPAEQNEGSGSFQSDRSKEADHKVYGRGLMVVAGDTYLRDKRIGAISLGKVDVEAHEEAALKGLQGTLTHDRPLVVVQVGALPAGTIDTLARLKSLFPAEYPFLAFENSLEGAVNGRYTLRRLTKKVFAERRSKLDVVAYRRERAALVPQP